MCQGSNGDRVLLMKTQQKYTYVPDSTTMKVDCEGSTAIANFTFVPLHFAEVANNYVWVIIEYRSGGTYSYYVPFSIFYSNLHIASVGKFVATIVKAHAIYTSERWGAEVVTC